MCGIFGIISNIETYIDLKKVCNFVIVDDLIKARVAMQSDKFFGKY